MAWATRVQTRSGGYTTEFCTERLYRDSKVLEIYEGTNEVQRNIIMKQVLEP